MNWVKVKGAGGFVRRMDVIIELYSNDSLQACCQLINPRLGRNGIPDMGRFRGRASTILRQAIPRLI